MAWVLAALAGVLGLLAVIAGGVAVVVARAARRSFEAALADDSDDGLRARGTVLVERIRSPALRWAVNRHTGAVAGRVAVGIVRDRLETMRRGGLLSVGLGIVALVLAIVIPATMR